MKMFERTQRKAGYVVTNMRRERQFGSGTFIRRKYRLPENKNKEMASLQSNYRSVAEVGGNFAKLDGDDRWVCSSVTADAGCETS